MEEMYGKRKRNWLALGGLVLVILYPFYMYLIVTPCNDKGFLISNPSERAVRIISYITWIFLFIILIVLFLAIFLGLKKYQKSGLKLSILAAALFILFHLYLFVFTCS